MPCGTVVYDGETGEFICEVKEHDERVVLLKGGRGGLGNWHFRTATNQAPRYAQPGEPAQERTVIMQLKVLADVGLVGFPNAGKSTLLSVVSAAKPEIADYPFTTLTPQLGIVSYRDGRSFCMADIPGIIEGASEGKGLGLRFLRHIERNAVLLFMVPATSEDIVAEYNILLRELEQYNPELLTKARILAVSKTDVPRLDEEGNELPDIRSQLDNGDACSTCVKDYFIGRIDKKCSLIQGCLKSKNENYCLICDTDFCLDNKGKCVYNYDIIY